MRLLVGNDVNVGDAPAQFEDVGAGEGVARPGRSQIINTEIDGLRQTTSGRIHAHCIQEANDGCQLQKRAQNPAVDRRQYWISHEFVPEGEPEFAVTRLVRLLDPEEARVRNGLEVALQIKRLFHSSSLHGRLGTGSQRG